MVAVNVSSVARQLEALPLGNAAVGIEAHRRRHVIVAAVLDKLMRPYEVMIQLPLHAFGRRVVQPLHFLHAQAVDRQRAGRDVQRTPSSRVVQA